MDADQDFLSIEQVTELLPGTTRSSLYTQKHRNLPPGSLSAKVGKRLLWRRSEIEHWFDQQRLAENQRQ